MASFVIPLLALAHAAAGQSFPQGTWTVTTTAGYTGGWGNRHENIPWAAVGVDYYLLNNLALGLEVTGAQILQPQDDATNVTLSAVLRQHLLDFDGTTLYADFLFGPSEASTETPAGGTRFNFVTRTGLGLSHPLTDTLDLCAGARYYHLSNGRINGADRNPSINGAEFYVGLIWRW